MPRTNRELLARTRRLVQLAGAPLALESWQPAGPGGPIKYRIADERQQPLSFYLPAAVMAEWLDGAITALEHVHAGRFNPTRPAAE